MPLLCLPLFLCLFAMSLPLFHTDDRVSSALIWTMWLCLCLSLPGSLAVASLLHPSLPYTARARAQRERERERERERDAEGGNLTILRLATPPAFFSARRLNSSGVERTRNAAVKLWASHLRTHQIGCPSSLNDRIN